MSQPSVGIVSAGMYTPDTFMTAGDIADSSGLPEWVVKEKLGIEKKYMPDSGVHPNQMGAWAAQDCLSKCDVDPKEIDVILCNTEEWREYLLWTSGINLAHEIGATNAWAMDLHMRCCTSIGALKTAKSIMLEDPDINTVMIAGGYNVGDFVNLKDHDTSWMFNIGAGGSAILLKKNWPENHVLGSHIIVDGSMNLHCVIPSSGTKKHPTDEAVKNNEFYFKLLEPEAMKSRLGEVSMDNWFKCIDKSLVDSGKYLNRELTRESVDFLNMIHVKPSAHKDMLNRLFLRETQSVYLSEYGHTGEHDNVIVIIESLRQGKLNDGDLMMMVGAGVGYVWGAACVQWGRVS
ncbi:MAG: 3-oxoacyl-ACP synthase [Candidatus Marinimicrobia bacterium]|jgi:3-oxoacyl-[acyl-carrier-protein] synthase-3|nr:3-oxoacyl-ACP synthase [Candidatus Neomarinimicrobiota bacterium]MDP6611184.1 3-oxoacyl-ACP synthase [Candidatus Neomarinimicrobiota bacterium]|tara:strand:- start:4901 stop:5941 length:1041 start_codon:yes stop_codon:yes gene_type:complete